ncbi:MAG: flavodoxin family protein [Kiritimatiellia bacterium]
MKILVVYYSRTGCTRMVADRLAQSLHADLLELQEQTNRDGVWGFIKGGFDAWRKNLTELAAVDKDLADYDLVVIGSPVWAGTLCPAVRTLLQQVAARVPCSAFFCTHGGGGASKSYADAERLLGKPLEATVALRDKDVKRGEMDPAISPFIRTLLRKE